MKRIGRREVDLYAWIMNTVLAQYQDYAAALEEDEAQVSEERYVRQRVNEYIAQN